MNDFLIREMKLSDSESVGHLWYELSLLHENFTSYYKVKANSEPMVVEYVKDLRNKGCMIYVAEVDGAVCGFVSGYIVRRNPQLEVQTIGKVDNLYVDEKYRRRGIGQALLARLFQHFKMSGTNDCEISCDVQNPDALRLYKRLGFKEQKVLLVKTD